MTDNPEVNQALMERELQLIKEAQVRIDAALTEHMEKEEVRWEEVSEKLHKTDVFINKFQGFTGGILFAATAVWTIISVVIGYFWSK